MKRTIKQLHAAAEEAPLRVFEYNFNAAAAERMRKTFAAELAEYAELQNAGDEGIYEITLRSRTRVITVPIGMRVGNEICGLVTGVISERLDELTDSILYHEVNALEEDEKEDREGTSVRAQALAYVAPHLLPTLAPPVLPHPATPRLRGNRTTREEAAAA